MENKEQEAIQVKAKREKIISRILTICIALILCVGCFFGGYIIRGRVQSADIRAIDYILTMYRAYYYDEQENVVGLFEDALLDQYSDYYTKEEYAEIQKGSQGRRENVGLRFSVYADGEGQKIVTSSPTWNSPADRAGVKAGGVIKAIKKSSESEWIAITSQAIFESNVHSYENNENFDLKIEYDGVEDVYTMAFEEYIETCVRYYDIQNEYCFRTVDGKMQFVQAGKNTEYNLQGANDIGVIKLSSFNGLLSGLEGCVGQFEKALEQFKNDGKTKLIFDLRGNLGGYLSILTDIATHLIDAEQGARVPIVIVKDKNEKQTIYPSNAVDSKNYGFEKMVVLADQNSASASEAMIGALLDYDTNNKTSVILSGYRYYDANGNIQANFKTYGKGIMQTTFENYLTGEAIKLTTAKLFWPKSNICIHGCGVTTAINDNSYFTAKKVYTESLEGENYGSVYDATVLLK